MQRTVLMSFKTKPQAEIILFTANVIQKMDGNPDYLVHQEKINALKPISLAFREAFAAASNNDELLNMVKDRKHLDLLKQLEIMAVDVDDIAKGDKEYIVGAGFEVRKEAQALTQLPTPTGFKAFNHEDNGSITLKWDKVPNRLNYAVEMRIVGEQTWQTVALPTLNTCTINGLTRGLHVEFRVRAAGTKNITSSFTRVIDVYVD
jgi:hypothetical protein